MSVESVTMMSGQACNRIPTQTFPVDLRSPVHHCKPKLTAKKGNTMPPKEIPDRIEPESLDDYLEIMSKVVFQSGMSWKVVEAKWETTREAFHNFATDRVADMSEEDLDKLAEDTRVIRNRRKLGAIAHNADQIIRLDSEHGSFQKYLRAHGRYEDTVKALRKDFKFLGDMGCQYFLYVVGEEVPEAC